MLSNRNLVKRGVCSLFGGEKSFCSLVRTCKRIKQYITTKRLFLSPKTVLASFRPLINIFYYKPKF